MERIGKIIMITLYLLCTSFILSAQNTGNSFIWGVNGHPLTQADYKNNLNQQIDAIKDLKLSSYRFDVILNQDGYAKNEPAFLNLLNSLKQNDILPLPAIMQSGFGSGGPDLIYQKTFQQGENFGTRYGKYFSVVEVNNEGDNKIRIREPGNGNSGKYDKQKAQVFIAEIKGFIDGIKKVKPSIKITLSVSYTHYYYLQMLKDNNVNYDIIGCHWYSNMGDITNLKPPYGNVLYSISQRFNKPIWITELNRFKGADMADFARQNDYITKIIKKIIAQGIVKAIYIYELFDQSSLAQRYPLEAHYGIMYKDASGNYVQKDAYKGLKNIVQNTSFTTNPGSSPK
jgi:hypothetical protein